MAYIIDEQGQHGDIFNLTQFEAVIKDKTAFNHPWDENSVTYTNFLVFSLFSVCSFTKNTLLMIFILILITLTHEKLLPVCSWTQGGSMEQASLSSMQG